MWKDAIGREHADGAGFIARCPCCNAFMHTHSLSGELVFNEQGCGVFSDQHQPWCSLQRASDAKWARISDHDEYFNAVHLLRA